MVDGGVRLAGRSDRSLLRVGLLGVESSDWSGQGTWIGTSKCQVDASGLTPWRGMAVKLSAVETHRNAIPSNFEPV